MNLVTESCDVTTLLTDKVKNCNVTKCYDFRNQVNMSIGYACLTVGVLNTNQRSCISKNASNERLIELITHNLNSLENIIEYNIKNDIKLFRISSDIIPFGSSPVNNIPWCDIFATQLQKIGEKIKLCNMRVSMHPGQYTVLNSQDEIIVKRAIEDLNYHTLMLDSLGVGTEHKIILHIGGVYNDKKLAIERFIVNYNHLSEAVKKRIVLENDDKSYNVCDVLEIGTLLKVPVVFDNLHNEVNSCDLNNNLYWINECSKTWQEKDGNQKIHYSQHDLAKRSGSHSNSIQINEFMEFYRSLEIENIDIMLEVKDKNLSAVKCINSVSQNRTIKALELEWSRYKYKVLECSPSAYGKIRKLLQNKNVYPVIPFYNLIEQALKKECNVGNSINAALHIWGYFKNTSSEKEKDSFLKIIKNYEQGKTSVKTIKNLLWKMTVKYQQQYLLDSYYFIQ